MLSVIDDNQGIEMIDSTTIETEDKLTGNHLNNSTTAAHENLPSPSNSDRESVISRTSTKVGKILTLNRQIMVNAEAGVDLTTRKKIDSEIIPINYDKIDKRADSKAMSEGMDCETENSKTANIKRTYTGNSINQNMDGFVETNNELEKVIKFNNPDLAFQNGNFETHKFNDNDKVLQGTADILRGKSGMKFQADISTAVISTMNDGRIENTTSSTCQLDYLLFLSKLKQYFQHSISDIGMQLDNNRYSKWWEFGSNCTLCYPFLSHHGIYVLVLNITSDSDNSQDNLFINVTDLQELHQQLTLIISSKYHHKKIHVNIDNANEEYSLPVIILVASYVDPIANQHSLQQRLKQIEQQLISSLPSIYRSHICSSGILFNCDANDCCQTTIEQRQQSSHKLLDLIRDFSSVLPFTSRMIPVRWYIMAALLQSEQITNSDDRLSNRSEDDLISNIMTFQQFQQVAINCGMYQEDQDLHNMLEYLHDLGVLLYCRQQIDDPVIVTNMAWLLNILGALVTINEHSFRSAAIRHDCQVAFTTGKISELCFDYVTRQFHLTSKSKELILRFMEYFCIACRIQSNDQDRQHEECHFFMPYILQVNTQQLDLTGYWRSNWLYVGYDPNDINSIPNFIFHCLLVSCLNHWKNSNVKLYSQYAIYDFNDEDYQLIIKQEKSFIGLQYCYRTIQDIGLAASVSDNIKLSIDTNRPHDRIKEQLSLIVDKQMPNCSNAVCRYYVQCPKCELPTCISHRYQDNPSIIRCHCSQVFISSSVGDWMIDTCYKSIGESVRFQEIAI